MTTAVSTRTLSRTTGRYVRATPGSQSLARGLALLRAFRPGIGVLTNADLASRTGLPRPTVSRLTHSLVDAGFLDYDHVQRGYRLSVVYLSLALSYRTSQIALDLALPLMRTLAEVRRLNVGLAVLDDAEMVYLDSVRLSRLGVFRRMVPGSRIPVATTALGRACLSAMESGDQARVMDALAEQEGLRWPSVKAEIEAAFRSIETTSACKLLIFQSLKRFKTVRSCSKTLRSRLSSAGERRCLCRSQAGLRSLCVHSSCASVARYG